MIGNLSFHQIIKISRKSNPRLFIQIQFLNFYEVLIIFNEDDLSNINFGDSLDNLFQQTAQHTFSIRVTYFLDYNNLKNVFKQIINLSKEQKKIILFRLMLFLTLICIYL